MQHNNNNNNNNMAASNMAASDMAASIAAFDKIASDMAVSNNVPLFLVYFHTRGDTNFPTVGEGELDEQTVVNLENLLKLCDSTMEATLSEINKLMGIRFSFSHGSSFHKKLAFLHGCLVKIMGFNTTSCKTVYQFYSLIKGFNDRLDQKVEDIRSRPDFHHTAREKKDFIENNGSGLPRPLMKLSFSKSLDETAAETLVIDFLFDFPELMRMYNYRRLLSEFLNRIPELETSEEIRGPIETGLKDIILIISDCTAKRIATRCNNLVEALAMWESLQSFITDNI
jgi:hypothetical protein